MSSMSREPRNLSRYENSQSYWEAVKQSIENGEITANFEVEGNTVYGKKSLLIYAAMYGWPSQFQFLIRNGANVNCVVSEFSDGSHQNLLGWMISEAVDVNRSWKMGRDQQWSLIELLVDNGASGNNQSLCLLGRHVDNHHNWLSDRDVKRIERIFYKCLSKYFYSFKDANSNITDEIALDFVRRTMWMYRYTNARGSLLDLLFDPAKHQQIIGRIEAVRKEEVNKILFGNIIGKIYPKDKWPDQETRRAIKTAFNNAFDQVFNEKKQDLKYFSDKDTKEEFYAFAMSYSPEDLSQTNYEDVFLNILRKGQAASISSSPSKP